MRIEQTEKTPLVYFEEQTNTIFFKGICVPENSAEFFEQIYASFKNLKLQNINIDFYLDYFNTSSTKELLKFLNTIKNQSPSVKIKWRHLENDEELLEAGELFQEITNLEFEYIIEY